LWRKEQFYSSTKTTKNSSSSNFIELLIIINISIIRQISKNLSFRFNNSYFKKDNSFINQKTIIFSSVLNKFLLISFSKQIYQNVFFFSFCLANSFHIHRNTAWTQNRIAIAAGNGRGNQMDQLNEPIDVIVDKKTDSLIIAVGGNKKASGSVISSKGSKSINHHF
jgi:hypothetical protein